MKKEGIFHTLWLLLPKKQNIILVFHNYKMIRAAACDFTHLRQHLSGFYIIFGESENNRNIPKIPVFSAL